MFVSSVITTLLYQTIHHEKTFTGLYTKWDSLTPRKCKVKLIRTLAYRCLPHLFKIGDEQTLTPSPWTTLMDYPNGLPKWTILKWTTPENTIISDEYYIKKLRFYTYTARICIFLNNYTEITTAGHQERRFKPHEVNFRSVVVGLSVAVP